MVNFCSRSISATRQLVWIRMEKSKFTKASKKRRNRTTSVNTDPKVLCSRPEDVTESVKIPEASSSGEQSFSETTSSTHITQMSVENKTLPGFSSSTVPVTEQSKISTPLFIPRVLYSTQSYTQFKKSMTSTNQQSKPFDKTSATESWMSSQPQPQEKEDYSASGKSAWSSYNYSKHYRKQKKGPKPPHKETTDPFGFANLPRKWEHTEFGLKIKKEGVNKSGLPFTVMSYNVLSQRLLEKHLHLYTSCSSESLDWEMRSERLLAELKYHKPDIVCLQEVQQDHYESFFRSHLRKMGYGCEYLKRSGDKPDGCATFFNLEKFSLIQSTPVEYYRGGLLDRDNVALILELAPNTNMYHGSANKICIANTHLLYNPRRGDIKLGQLMVLLAELDMCLHKPVEKDNLSDHNDLHVQYSPVVLCGDFNSGPYSEMYKFLSSGYVHYEGLLARLFSGQKEGVYGRNHKLHRHFFNQSFGITDQCQYVEHLIKRHMQMQQLTASENTDTGAPVTLLCESSSSEHLSFENVGFEQESLTSKSGPENINISNIVQSLSHIDENPKENWEAELQDNEIACSSDSSTSNMNAGDTGYSMPYYSHASGKLWHKFNFISAYKHRIQRRPGAFEKEVTTLHNTEGCTVDYIFYSGRHCDRPEGKFASKEGKLKLLSRYGLMSAREINNIGGLPNQKLASDHISLLTKFLLQ